MDTVEKENEIILRAQEELNQILLEKFYNEEKDKQIESDTMSCQHKSKKSKYSKIESSSSYKINGHSHRKKHQYSSDSSESNYRSREKKFNPYEDIFWDFKRLNHQILMAKQKKKRKPKHGCPE